MKTRARYYETSDAGVQCFLCPHKCRIHDGQAGRCRVRFCEDGVLYSMNYGEITSAALDPIEKKPLKYFRPGSFIYSVGSYGCNFTCSFCQNYEISQFEAYSRYVAPQTLVETAIGIEGNVGIAFTYNEPTVGYEYVYDCARLLKERRPDMAVVLVTNGYINEEPLKEILPYVDAMNIDLKSFNPQFYTRICGGSLEPVRRVIEIAVKTCHVEVTTLLVTGENDKVEEVEAIAAFLAGIDPNIPLHLSRYFPRYKMDEPATDLMVMRRARDGAKKYLNRVELGNV